MPNTLTRPCANTQSQDAPNYTRTSGPSARSHGVAWKGHVITLDVSPSPDGTIGLVARRSDIQTMTRFERFICSIRQFFRMEGGFYWTVAERDLPAVIQLLHPSGEHKQRCHVLGRIASGNFLNELPVPALDLISTYCDLAMSNLVVANRESKRKFIDYQQIKKNNYSISLNPIMKYYAEILCYNDPYYISRAIISAAKLQVEKYIMDDIAKIAAIKLNGRFRRDNENDYITESINFLKSKQYPVAVDILSNLQKSGNEECVVRSTNWSLFARIKIFDTKDFSERNNQAKIEDEIFKCGELLNIMHKSLPDILKAPKRYLTSRIAEIYGSLSREQTRTIERDNRFGILQSLPEESIIEMLLARLRERRVHSPRFSPHEKVFSFGIYDLSQNGQEKLIDKITEYLSHDRSPLAMRAMIEITAQIFHAKVNDSAVKKLARCLGQMCSQTAFTAEALHLALDIYDEKTDPIRAELKAGIYPRRINPYMKEAIVQLGSTWIPTPGDHRELTIGLKLLGEDIDLPHAARHAISHAIAKDLGAYVAVERCRHEYYPDRYLLALLSYVEMPASAQSIFLEQALIAFLRNIIGSYRNCDQEDFRRDLRSFINSGKITKESIKFATSGFNKFAKEAEKDRILKDKAITSILNKIKNPIFCAYIFTRRATNLNWRKKQSERQFKFIRYPLFAPKFLQNLIQDSDEKEKI